MSNNSSKAIGERFLEFLNEIRETSNSISKKIGLSSTSAKKIEKGDNLPSAKILIPLAEEYPKLNLRWLLVGEGQMWNDQPVEEPTTSIPEDVKHEMKLMRMELEANKKLIASLNMNIGLLEEQLDIYKKLQNVKEDKKSA